MTANSTKPTATATAPMPFSKDDPRRQRVALVAGVGGAALGVALAVLLIFRPWQRSAMPRLNDEPAKLARFAASPNFAKLPFDQREVYMKMMDKKKTQITAAYSAGTITDEEYSKTLESAHLGKRLDEMKKYFSKPVGAARDAYLEKLLAKEDKKHETLKRNPSAKQEKKQDQIPRDNGDEQAEMSSWPPEIRAQYETFHQALAERKKRHKEAKAEKKQRSQPAVAAPTEK